MSDFAFRAGEQKEKLTLTEAEQASYRNCSLSSVVLMPGIVAPTSETTICDTGSKGLLYAYKASAMLVTLPTNVKQV